VTLVLTTKTKTGNFATYAEAQYKSLHQFYPVTHANPQSMAKPASIAALLSWFGEGKRSQVKC
jgi:hypothetical protein